MQNGQGQPTIRTRSPDRRIVALGTHALSIWTEMTSLILAGNYLESQAKSGFFK